MKKILTIGVVRLDKPYLNIKNSVVYVIGNNEFSIESKLCPSDNYYKLFEFFGIEVKEKIVERDVNAKVLDIEGIVVTRVKPHELKFECESKGAANKNVDRLTTILESQGYIVVGSEIWECSRKRCNIQGKEEFT